MQLAGLLRTELHCNALLHVPAAQALLCGMYEHTPSDDKRYGAIVAAPDTDPLGEKAWTKADLTAEVRQHVEGVFDMRLLTSSIVVAGRTDGSVTLIEVKGPQEVRQCTTIPVGTDMVTTAFAVGNDTLFTTHHKGAAALVDASGTGMVLKQWTAHEFDAWAGDALPSGSVVCTGGDDGKLKLWDLRAQSGSEDDEDGNKGKAPLAAGMCRFEAGVVTVLAQATHRGLGGLGEHHLLVGTYDEQVAIVDIRAMKRPLAAGSAGGGAWRIRPIAGPAGEGRGNVAIAAMHGGAIEATIDATKDGDAMVAVAQDEARYHCHKDDVLVYDVAPLPDGRVASVSFYDNELCVWKQGKAAVPQESSAES